mmetsp:Transcript_174847/g.560616  ORF Transcript_174847/g.560616 Transcript_174847/m.560616 type:complete len:273 (+) Transcript_174847:87-905(+)
MATFGGLFNVVLAICVLVARAIIELPADPLGGRCSFERLAVRPRLFHCRGFASQAWIDAFVAESEALLAANQVCRSRTCRSYADDLASRPVLNALMEKLYTLFSEEAAAEARTGYKEQPLNILRYDVGGDTNWHIDPQHRHPNDLLASAILYIGSPAEGGETTFRKSEPAPMVVPPLAGDLAIFVSCDGVGDDEEKSEHTGMKVLSGNKLVLEKFFSLPRWFCTQGFSFPAPDEITVIRETAKAAQMLSDERTATPQSDKSDCQSCLDSGSD